MDSVFINGLKISGYRSFKSETTFDNLSKINLIIGQNNSGKSNLLRFLSRHIENFRGGNGTPFNDVNDVPKHSNEPMRIGYKLSQSNLLRNQLVQKEYANHLNDALYKSNNSVWFYYERKGNEFNQSDHCLRLTKESIGAFAESSWLHLWSNIHSKSGGKLDMWVTETLRTLSPLSKIRYKVDLIPATRSLNINQKNNGAFSIENDGRIKIDNKYDHSGSHLIEELFQLQNPPTGKEENKVRFDKINQFMRDVIGNETLQLEIPHTKDNVIVNMDDKRLNIGELGSGIEEMLIIAAKCTIFSEQIVCIEEPELHLHPTLQRKLLQYLHDKTNNQYFIATHSAHLLDAVKCSIYHVKLEDKYSKVISAINERDKFHACNDLGYKASDLLQSNFIIWVEGPSDRIYINHWIKSLAPDLLEGLHYSIMFYGGRLLSHLSAESETVTEFIALQKLNQNMAIIIDSDRKKKGDKINKTKQRIRAEFEKYNHFVWITEGKEIENYIAADIYKNAVHSIYGKKANLLANFKQYSDMTIFYSAKAKTEKSKKKIDKIRLAHAVTESEADLSILDLQKSIQKLVEQINKANLLHV